MSPPSLQKASERRPEVEFVPVHWWQAISFIRLNFELVRGIDPLADQILSRPWALSSWLEYAYMLGTFLRSRAHFVYISGERAGLVWADYRARIGFVLSVGLLPQFQQLGIGAQIVNFIEDYARRHGCDALVTVMAASNKPVRRLAKGMGGHPLGLATTALILSTASQSTSATVAFRIEQQGRAEAVMAWKHWRLHEVGQVAGSSGVDVAARLLVSDWLPPLPRGKYLALYQDEQEIGCAFARWRHDELEIGLFPTAAFWPGPETASLIAALASYLESPVRHLVLTQTHANALDSSTVFEFERRREQERVFSFKRLDD